jgi:hypothetical protein
MAKKLRAFGARIGTLVPTVIALLASAFDVTKEHILGTLNHVTAAAHTMLFQKIENAWKNTSVKLTVPKRAVLTVD